jgi:hypothetical protein
MIGYNLGTNESGRAVFEAPPTVASERVRSRMRPKSIPTLTPAQQEAFWNKVEVPHQPSCCWHWTGSIDPTGYGKFKIYQHSLAYNRKVHRIAFTLLIGEIPDDLTIDHLCRNRGCVNPDHMQLVTLGDNIRRSNGLSRRLHRGDTCQHGHTEIYITASGKRSCRVCDRRRTTEYTARKKAKAA